MFETMGNTDTGLQLLRSDLAPFFEDWGYFCYFPFAWENAIVYVAY